MVAVTEVEAALIFSYLEEGRKYCGEESEPGRTAGLKRAGEVPYYAEIRVPRDEKPLIPTFVKLRLLLQLPLRWQGHAGETRDVFRVYARGALGCAVNKYRRLKRTNASQINQGDAPTFGEVLGACAVAQAIDVVVKQSRSTLLDKTILVRTGRSLIDSFLRGRDKRALRLRCRGGRVVRIQKPQGPVLGEPTNQRPGRS